MRDGESQCERGMISDFINDHLTTINLQFENDVKFRCTLIDLLESYDSGMVSSFIGLSHDVYLPQDVLPAGFPSPALLEHLGGILLSATFLCTPLYYGEFPPADIANVNATVYTCSAVYKTAKMY